MKHEDKIYVAGHTGMVGSAIVRALKKEGFNNLILKTSEELDLRNQSQVNFFFEKEKIDYVFLAAAKVGGIFANNTYRAEFLYDNLMIAANVIHASYQSKVKKLIFLGSSCIYPKYAEQPISEDSLLTGALEPTNEPYAIAKIAGLKLCENYRRQYGCNFISVMPTNLYGPNDNYDLENAHVLPALLRKFHEARQKGLEEVCIWGDGSPLREFMHVDDLARACLFLMQTYEGPDILNIGSGEEISIKDLAMLISKIVGFEGKLFFDAQKPNGTPRKLLDCSRLRALGFQPSITLEKGIKEVYEEYISKYVSSGKAH
jgi:GDP-L-fucose synthase